MLPVRLDERGDEMKGALFAAIAIGSAAVLASCSASGSYKIKPSGAYGLSVAIARGDIVMADKTYHFDRFERFRLNVAVRAEDRIRITGYTDEGNPVYKDLWFDGTSIQYTYDNSNDEYGGSGRAIRTDECAGIALEKDSNGASSYILQGCQKNDANIGYFLLRAPDEPPSP